MSNSFPDHDRAGHARRSAGNAGHPEVNPLDTGASAPVAAGVAIAGVGLIGGSIALAVRQGGFDGPIVGIGRNPERLEAARQQGVIDSWVTDPVEAAGNCDLFVFCTPVNLIARGVRSVAAACRPGTLLSDAGSSKDEICRELRTGLPEGVTFIGSHPLAGSEQQGFEHAAGDLYQGRTCVLTPWPETPRGELERLRRFWELLGMQVVTRSPEDHDLALARTSHLPHVAAAALTAILDGGDGPLAATGFRDTTRIAAGDPDLWVAILESNRAAVLVALEKLGGTLDEFRQTLASGDSAGLKKLLQDAKRNRDALDIP